MRSGTSGVQGWLSTLSRPCACTRPLAVTMLAFSGRQASVAGTHASSVRWRKARMRSRLRAGSLMSARMASSRAWHSTRVVPKNMERVTGRQLPGALGWQSKRKPDMSCGRARQAGRGKSRLRRDTPGRS